MKIKGMLFFFSLVVGGFVGAESLNKSELSELVTSFFVAHEDQVKEFHAQGGYLPDTAESYSLLNRLEAEDLAEEPSSEHDRLKAINYLKRQVINVGIICAPGAAANAKELSDYRERVMRVYLALELRETELLLNVKDRKESL